MEENGIWFKLQPTLSFWAVAIYMGWKLRKGKGLFLEMMNDMKPDGPKPPEFIMKSMERNMMVMFFLYGCLMAVLAVWFDTSVWAFFKTAGFFIVIGVFMIIQMILNKKAMKRVSKL